MLSLPRRAVRKLRVFVRKVQPRGPTPPLVLTPSTRGCTLTADFDDVVIRLFVPGPAVAAAPFTLPMAALDAVEGNSDDPVRIEPDASSVALAPCHKPRPRWSWPTTMTPVPHPFLAALHEASRCAAKSPGRYDLHRVQVRGAAGAVIGTDGQIVVRFDSVPLPFSEDVLVPATGLFGLDEWSRGEIRLGCTRSHLVIVRDNVTVGLRLYRDGRFPDVDAVIPTSSPVATLTLDPDDAKVVIDRLPALPQGDDPRRPVTLDLTPGTIIVRAAASDASRVEVPLSRSKVTGQPALVAVDRRHLVRVLSLGARTLRVHPDPQPIVATGPHLTALVMPLDVAAIVPDSHPQPRSTPMKSPEPSPREEDAPDPLAEAEALRAALADALQRLGRLMAALRHRRKEAKALTQVWSSLKSLRLGG